MSTRSNNQSKSSNETAATIASAIKCGCCEKMGIIRPSREFDKYYYHEHLEPAIDKDVFCSYPEQACDGIMCESHGHDHWYGLRGSVTNRSWTIVKIRVSDGMPVWRASYNYDTQKLTEGKI